MSQLCHYIDNHHTILTVRGTWGDVIWLTLSSTHATGYFHQDPWVAEDHDDQREQEETYKSKHVVKGLLPVVGKASSGGALGEVLWHCDRHVVEQKHLRENTVVILLPFSWSLCKSQ